MSWPSNPDGSIQVAGEIINTGIEAIHSLSHWFMNANVVKGLVQRFNELCVVCICKGRMTDVVYFSLLNILSPWCVTAMPRGARGWGNDPLHYTTGGWSCFFFFFSPPHRSALLTIAWMAVCSRLFHHICVMTTFLRRVPVRVIIPDPIVDDRRKGWRGQM